MDIELVRLADRWIGTLGCRILSAVAWLKQRISPASPTPAPHRILFIEISEMGSVILAHSVIREAQRRYPEADVYFLMFQKIRESLDVLGLVPPENVITLDDRNLWAFARSAWRANARLRQLHIDTVLDMELFARISAILSFLSGAPTRVGFYRYNMEGLYRGTFLTHKVQYNPYIHISRNQLALLDALKESPVGSPLVKRVYDGSPPPPPQLKNTPEEDRAIHKKLSERCSDFTSQDRLVILNPGGGKLPIRAWPLEHYIQLTHMLLDEENLLVGVMGLPSQRQWYRQLADQISSNRLFDFTGMTETVGELVQFFNCCDVLVTSDSGPAHFASLASIHCIAFFGPETPVLYGPLGKHHTTLYSGLSCSPCLTAYNHRNSPCDGNNVCVKEFSPQYVHGLVLAALEQRCSNTDTNLLVR